VETPVGRPDSALGRFDAVSRIGKLAFRSSFVHNRGMDGLATLAAYAKARADMRVKCRCGREVNLPSASLGSVFGAWITVEEARSRLKCKRCGQRGVATVSPSHGR